MKTKTAQEVAALALEYGWLKGRLERPDFDAEDRIQRDGRVKRTEELKMILTAIAEEET